MKLTQKLKDQLWWMIISVDYDYSRICIAEHELNEDTFSLWLEDKQDFKNSLDECLLLDISLKQFAKIIKTEGLNSYEGTKVHPTKNFAYKTRIQINEAINWYREDASLTEQQWAREAVLRNVLTYLVETEAATEQEWI
ncbi:hypothetical protein [Mucilaginibacter glaciei]|uniref:Uncharacterized protein n=1 Tax=Mucilaginibacter glaciei TaxID=2772109 RepID=A0A926S360_9SPHI|nr:hypothetical protein [Mucilaginibacter glaciei]MBD1394587.1 hypothetical protein [Mucilaginibacter glaciei]